MNSRFGLDYLLPPGDSLPSVAPDGSRMAFVRNLPTSAQDQVVVSNIDGSRASVIEDTDGGLILTLDWSAEDRIIVTKISPRITDGQIFIDYEFLAMNPAGEDREVIMAWSFASEDGSGLTDESVSFQDISPQGEMLYSYANGPKLALRMRDLSTGSDRRIAVGSFDAAFSSDGQDVAYATTECVGDRQCRITGWPNPGLWTVRADGTNREKVVSGPGEFASPDFSPDGGRIAFSSSRNFPTAGAEAQEIYSVKPDGSCLTWLTNGTPASTDPEWVPSPHSTKSANCGMRNRSPLVEVTPSRNKGKFASPRLWAGPRVDERLLSSVESVIPGSRWDVYSYGDCASFYRAACGRPISVEVGPVCGAPFGPALTLGSIRRTTLLKRGVLITSRTAGRRLQASRLLTRSAQVVVGADRINSPGIGPKVSTKDHIQVLRRLRTIEGQRVERFGPSRIRRGWVRSARRSKRAFDRFGSVTKAAKSLDASQESVRFGVRLIRTLDRAKFRATSCEL